jgi:dipeptidyl aminopeptidase/acylaminoacyl peptidase
VSASADAGTTAPGAYRAAWSPRSDLIACVVADGDAESLALVSPDLPGPVEATALSALTTDVTASRIESRWSPQGDRIAVLATDPRFATQPGVLYVVEVPTGWAGETPLEPRELARLDDPAQPISPPAWSADGQRLAAVVGAEVWVWDAETATGQRWHAFPATFEEVSVHWSPGGNGFVVRHGEQLHWFTADAPGDPAQLLQRNGLDRIEFAGP